ncbi:10343_t:CDS:10 [Entrophospora sp. SA101]|nr:10343_t:CDS:10 [Entrophospora sp. SA101]
MEEQKEPQTSNANTPSSNAAVPPPQSTTSISSTASTLQDVVMEDASSLSAAPTELISNNEKDSTEDTIELNKGNNQRIVEEFQYLLEKSQQLFAGLRDLPPTGGRQWQPYFQRTFEVYTKQQNRFVLENKDNYGLKRWEVGEIASKIGQLYYHYYLRTSETNYLHESYIFYEAIRERAYFKDILDVKNPALMIKKLRYYARFIVVCLLLNNREIVQKLMDELSGLVDDYIKNFKPVDSLEWQLVLQEIGTFLEAERKLVPTTPDGHMLSFPRRLQIERSPRHDKDGTLKLKLQEAILVGNYQNQIKFSELTLDMYHILQSLEREPLPLPKSVPNKPPGSAENPILNERIKAAFRRVNPHKYLLYKPTFSQLMVYIATAFKETTDNSAFLLYISADGAKSLNNDQESTINGYNGGIATSSKKPTENSDSVLVSCLHPSDLVPFTRKALFLIIDSDNNTSQIGSLFTLFLHAPLLGFSFISDIGKISSETWGKCVDLVIEIESKIIELFNITNLDRPIKRFLQDDFLRQFLVRYVLCYAILKSHTSFEEKHLPYSCPQLPSSILDSPEILTQIKELVTTTQVESRYSFPNLETEEKVPSDTDVDKIE